MRAPLASAIGLLCGVLAASGCYESQSQYGGESHFLRPCTKTAECSDLGDEYACVVGRCRAPDAGAHASSANDAGAKVMQPAIDASESQGATALNDATPLVLILVDTSGSMERTTSCTCTSPSCKECLPDCEHGERNRWAQTLEALTGTFQDFACEAIERTPENGMTYDVGYDLDYHRPSGTQRDDGVLDEYRDRLRFGIATFDGFDTFVGAAPLVAADAFQFNLSYGEAGLWSYNPEHAIGVANLGTGHPTGGFLYPNCDQENFIDTGIRSSIAAQGALRVATDLPHALDVNAEIQRSLLDVRPYGGTPIASSLDDLYYFLGQDPEMEVERARAAPVHVVLITDGYPDDDYRAFGCNCAAEGRDCGGPPNDPLRMHCPYPTAEAAATKLRCGADLELCRGPATQLHVVGLAIDDSAVSSRLDAIAIAGGDRGAHFAASKLELYSELDEILGAIAAK